MIQQLKKNERIPQSSSELAMNQNEYLIRQAKISDMDDLYEICICTGNNGEDAHHLYNIHEALGIYYVGPYVVFEQELAFVLEDKMGICGYVLGTKDTKLFFQTLTEQWLPKYQNCFPMPDGDAENWNHDQKIVALIHHPNISLPESLNDFPAHLHIDLLPRARKKGNGRRMIDTLHKKLKKFGIKGVFLDVGINNINAQSFYERIGYKKLEVTPSQDGLFMIQQL